MDETVLRRVLWAVIAVVVVGGAVGALYYFLNLKPSVESQTSNNGQTLPAQPTTAAEKEQVLSQPSQTQVPSSTPITVEQKAQLLAPAPKQQSQDEPSQNIQDKMKLLQ